MTAQHPGVIDTKTWEETARRARQLVRKVGIQSIEDRYYPGEGLFGADQSRHLVTSNPITLDEGELHHVRLFGPSPIITRFTCLRLLERQPSSISIVKAIPNLEVVAATSPYHNDANHQ